MEDSISAYYQFLSSKESFCSKNIKLEKSKHAAFLKKGLGTLASGYVVRNSAYYCITPKSELQVKTYSILEK